MNIEAYLELSALQPDVVLEDIKKICSEAAELNFTAVCVPPLFVKNAKIFTAGTGIQVSTVIGFPFGYSAIEAKVAEVVLAILDGTDEVEFVANTSAIKNNDWQFLASEINTIMPVVRARGKKITAILETGLLSGKEIVTACDIYGAAGVDYIKAGTGYLEDAAAVDHVKLIRDHLATAIQLKTAFEIKNYRFAVDLVHAGANRLCCSNGLTLIQEALLQSR